MYAFVINAIGVVVGALVGLALKDHLPRRLLDGIKSALGLLTLVLAITLVIKGDFLLVAGSVLAGTAIGEALHIEAAFNRMADYFKSKVKARDSTFAEGMVTAALITCIGPLAILGSLADGLSGDPTLIYSKTMLDAFASASLAATLGIGVAFSAIPLLIYQGAITLAASLLSGYLTAKAIGLMSAVGGVLIFGISLDLLGLKKVRLANMLPSIGIAFVLALI